MGRNTNIGQELATTVFGNPQSFFKLISNHGQLAKIKQALTCPCVSANNGSADIYCELCNGDGYVYSYQRRFLISDENSNVCGDQKTLKPFYVPILSVSKVQSVTSEVQGGIINYDIDSFTEDTIVLKETICPYTKKRVTYTFDGWTYVEREKLRVDKTNKLMYADGTIEDAGYQSSNPLNAYADIAQVIRIWNEDTGENLKNYKVEGNTISTTLSISENMYIEYYKADLTKVINQDVVNN